MDINEYKTPYHISKYKLEEHKYEGWYWEHETQQFMRWNDMMDYYADNE